MSDMKNNWEVPYHKAFFKTSHNSYEHSIRAQLNSGVRGLEYDIHDDNIQELNDFEVYHLRNNIDVLLNEDGNPDNYLLSNWLKVLNDWSIEKGKDNAPITLFIELKDNFIDSNNQPDELYGLKKLNSIIMESFKRNSLYTFKDFRENKFKWPIIQDLKGCILIVLVSYWGGYWAASEGGFESRLRYLSNCLEGKDDICFVSWVQEDKGNKAVYLKENTHFWKCSLNFSTENFTNNTKSQRLTRVDYDKIIWGKHVKTYFKKNFKSGYRCNFPATDAWRTERYNSCFPWYI